jgi:hypothetical protein
VPGAGGASSGASGVTVVSVSITGSMAPSGAVPAPGSSGAMSPELLGSS